MITIEQLKDVKERTAAFERYLDIENKLVQVEEEQLRTQAPGFWDDEMCIRDRYWRPWTTSRWRIRRLWS